MTNKEKFKEVFGVKPDTNSVPIHCEDCKYFESLGYCTVDGICESWWNEEYESAKITPIKEYKSAKPTPISKDTSHIISIFSCPYHLPCGWCEKRDMLCVEIGGKL